MSVDSPATVGSNRDSILVDGLSVGFPGENGTVLAVNDISLRFPGHRITGVIGESGSGKSVLGTSMIGLNPNHAIIDGRILVGDRNVCRLSNQELYRLRRSRIALIPQNPSASLNPVMRIENQIVEGVGHKRKPSIKRAIDDCLAELDLSGISKQYPFRLSGGMKQRALIAMGLIRKPSWLLADEPTKGLDARLRCRVFKLLNTLYCQRRIGIILISHDLPFAARLCHHIAVLYCGRVMETGLAKDLFSAPVHPYTRALLRALPQNGLVPIPGPVATVGAPPSGCPFHPRCPRHQTICRRQFPPVRLLEEDREVYCHYA